MIYAIMLIALGFLAASLIGVLLAPSLWSRASRLSKKRLESTLPLTLAEIEATQDQLRASYAVRLRRLETALASAKQKAANQLVDNSRLQMQIASLNEQIGDLDLKLSERRNAATVLEQTITKRFPELDREISSVKAQLQERSYELQDLTNKLARRDEELAAAQAAASSYEDELTRLRQVLEKSGSDRGGRRVRRASQWDIEDYRAEYDRLNLELSKLRQQLAQFQDRDAQQVGVIKGELQKLAELILASAQPKAAPRFTDRPEPAAKRLPAQESRRERPMPWLQQNPAPLAARLKRAADPVADPPPEPAPLAEPSAVEQSPAGPPPATPPLSPVFTFLQEETVLTGASKNGQGDAGARSKILQEVVGVSTPPSAAKDEPGVSADEEAAAAGRVAKPSGPQDDAAAGENQAEPGKAHFAARVDGPAMDETGPAPSTEAVAAEALPERQEVPSSDVSASQHEPEAPAKTASSSENDPAAEEAVAPPPEPELARSEKPFTDARDLQSISEFAKFVAGNGAHNLAQQNGPAEEARLGNVIDIEVLQPGPEEKAEGRSHTLLERLRGVAEEPAEAEK